MNGFRISLAGELDAAASRAKRDGASCDVYVNGRTITTVRSDNGAWKAQASARHVARCHPDGCVRAYGAEAFYHNGVGWWGALVGIGWYAGAEEDSAGTSGPHANLADALRAALERELARLDAEGCEDHELLGRASRARRRVVRKREIRRALAELPEYCGARDDSQRIAAIDQAALEASQGWTPERGLRAAAQESAAIYVDARPSVRDVEDVWLRAKELICERANRR